MVIKGYVLLMAFSTIINLITYRLSYIENPFLDFLFLSNIVSRQYLLAPGDTVKSFVKSDFLPYPMLVPFLFIVGGIL